MALFRAPLWLFALLVLGVALLAAREYFDIAEATGFKPMRAWGYIFTACAFIGTSLRIWDYSRPYSDDVRDPLWTPMSLALLLLVFALR